MQTINSNTINTITGSIEPIRDQNGNILSITSSKNQLNEINQFISMPSILNYYTSSYLDKVFDIEFTEFGVESDEKFMNDLTVPQGTLLISQSEYDELVQMNAILNEKIFQLELITGSLEQNIEVLEGQINLLLLGSGSITGSVTGSITGSIINTTGSIDIEPTGSVTPRTIVAKIKATGSLESNIVTQVFNVRYPNERISLVGNGTLVRFVAHGDLEIRVAQNTDLTFNQAVNNLKIIKNNRVVRKYTHSTSKIFSLIASQNDNIEVNVNYKTITI